MRVLLVAPNASAKMGGEAILPLHWLRELRGLGVDAELLTHARCREELSNSSYSEFPIHYVEDSALEVWIWKRGAAADGFMQRLNRFLLPLISTFRLGRETRRLAAGSDYDLIHQVIPVSPRLASPITHPKIPVIIGPMNGNMTYPAGFSSGYGGVDERAERFARWLSVATHFVLPGKLRASRLLVSNSRTRSGLPRSVTPDRVALFVENGVDLRLWTDVSPLADGPTRFVFVGRLVDWKALDLLIAAFKPLPSDWTLTVCGDGDMRGAWESVVEQQGLTDRVTFLGAMPQSKVRDVVRDSHVLMLPSVYECGGAVVLEAMAMERPVIATNWGGPADYITDETGILVDPTSVDEFKDGLTAAMLRLGQDPQLMMSMGQAGRARIEEQFSWSRKGSDMLKIYKDVLGSDL